MHLVGLAFSKAARQEGESKNTEDETQRHQRARRRKREENEKWDLALAKGFENEIQRPFDRHGLKFASQVGVNFTHRVLFESTRGAVNGGLGGEVWQQRFLGPDLEIPTSDQSYKNSAVEMVRSVGPEVARYGQGKVRLWRVCEYLLGEQLAGLGTYGAYFGIGQHDRIESEPLRFGIVAVDDHRTAKNLRNSWHNGEICSYGPTGAAFCKHNSLAGFAK